MIPPKCKIIIMQSEYYYYFSETQLHFDVCFQNPDFFKKLMPYSISNINLYLTCELSKYEHN